MPRSLLPVALGEEGDGAADTLEPWREVDIQLSHGRIEQVRITGGPAPAATDGIDLGGVLVFPGLLDAHTHLDKCHTWERAPNPRGEFWDALTILREDSVRWSAEDVYRRAGFGLRQAWEHGTIALRSHLDSDKPGAEESFAAIDRLRQEWRGRIELQTVSLCNLAAFVDGQAGPVMALTAKHAASALGGFPQPNADLPRQLDYLLAAAAELGVGLDLHVDESGLLEAECLRAVAEAVLRRSFPHPVTCGHCCSLARQSLERQRSTIDLVREARLNIVTLPLCNQYLQGRGAGCTPSWRGLTVIHELLAAGVTVASASDNVRDAFYAWGDFDLIEVFQQTVRMAHLDTRLNEAPRLVTTAAARVMGLPLHGQVAPGAPAALVVTEARTFNELLARPGRPRRLVHGGSLRPAAPPAFAELAG